MSNSYRGKCSSICAKTVFPAFIGNPPSHLYENAPSLYPSPSTGEGGVGVIFILRCAHPGHGGYWEEGTCQKMQCKFKSKKKKMDHLLSNINILHGDPPTLTGQP